jgi:carboxypeptidase C (cathepsin A)
MRNLFVSAAVLNLIMASGSYAADEPAKKPDKVADQIEAATVHAPIGEVAKTTTHSITINGKAIAYKATAGTLTLRDATGKPEGTMFYVAYTADPDKKGSKRPVTFLYNGGPGSPTMWLHMGSVGPMIVKTNSPDNTPPAPYTVTPNPDSILDKTDLVFIDAMGAGYSRPLGDAKGEKFFGVDQDSDAFARAILRYVKINDRWNSPKFLFGESYGTLRSGVLADMLQDRGLDISGVILLSSILNYGVRQPGYDQNYMILMPTYAATAWYHNALKNKPADLAAFVQKAREFATGPYASALAKGTSISPEEENAIAQQLSDFIGISPDYIKKARLRVDLGRFRKELLRDREQTIGRLDTRFIGIDADSAGEEPENDPASTAVTSAYFSALNTYLKNDLGYETELEYKLSARGPDFKWDWKHKFDGYEMNNPNTALDLGEAMRTNPNLKVLSLFGYYDTATPFLSTEFDLAHMPLEPAQIKNISHAYYEAGHMVYLHQPSLDKLKVDLDSFYDAALKK